MGEWVAAVAAVTLADNLLLERLLGVYALEAGSRRSDVALGLAGVTLVLLIVAAGLGWLLRVAVLEPLGLGYIFLPITLLPLLAMAVAPLQYLLRRLAVPWGRRCALLLPLALFNAAVLGIPLLNAHAPAGLLTELGRGLGGGLGFALVLVLYADLRERIALVQVPAPFRGIPVQLVTLGILAMAFAAFG